MSDIVSRLRDWKAVRMTPEKMSNFIQTAQEAADEIERLRDLVMELSEQVDSFFDNETNTTD